MASWPHCISSATSAASGQKSSWAPRLTIMSIIGGFCVGSYPTNLLHGKNVSGFRSAEIGFVCLVACEVLYQQTSDL
jgi:hypothetical protein